MEYIPSLIEAAAGIASSVLGAFIAAGYLSRVFEKNISPLFYTYSDEKHDVYKLIRKADSSIYVVVGVGDQFLRKYEKRLEKCLKRGVTLHFLMQTESQYCAFERYIHAVDDSDDCQYVEVRESALCILNRLKLSYPNQVQVREFHGYLTASYIGIDIDERNVSPKWSPHAIIQVMIYQYGVAAQDSPISYFSAKHNQKLFESTANSIMEMWGDGKRIDAKGEAGRA